MIGLILGGAGVLVCAGAAYRLDLWFAERERRRIVCDKLRRYGWTRRQQ